MLLLKTFVFQNKLVGHEPFLNEDLRYIAIGSLAEALVGVAKNDLADNSNRNVEKRCL